MVAVNINGFNVGTDASITLADSSGDVFPADLLGHLLEFSSSAEDMLLKVTPISNGGIPIYQTIWHGHSGRMRFARQNGNLQNMITSLMQAYHQEGIIEQFTITANVLNRDGTVDEYLYSGVQFTKPDFGDYRAEKEVDVGLSFSASILTITGGASPFLQQFAA